MIDPVRPTYAAEAIALEKNYWRLIGEAIGLEIKVYRPDSGGQLKDSGELMDEIHAITTYRPKHQRRTWELT